MVCVFLRDAAKGDSKLYVTSTADLSVGDWLRMTLDNPTNNSLIADLHSGSIPATANLGAKPNLLSFMAKVIEVSCTARLYVNLCTLSSSSF